MNVGGQKIYGSTGGSSGNGLNGANGAGSRGTSRPSEMEENVLHGIHAISNNALTLERLSEQINSTRDNAQLRRRIHLLQAETADQIDSSMHAMRVLNQQYHDRQDMLRLRRYSTDLQSALTRYNRLQQNIVSKAKSAAPQGQQTGPQQSALLDLEKDVEAGWQGGDQERQRQEQQNEQRRLQEIRTREEEIRQLEADIIDVNQIFRDLSHLVHEQGEKIDTIEANIETAHGNVVSANVELNRAVTYQSKARRKKCCLLVILLVVAIIITLVIVLSVTLKK